MKNLIIFVFILFPFVAFGATSEEGLELRRTLAIQIYMGTCVLARANAESVGEEAIRMGFIVAPNERRESYLSGRSGQAWYMNNDQGEFGISVLNNSLCSVFVHQGDPQQLQDSMEAWLPPENSGYSYEKKLVAQSGSLSTYMYKIFRENQFIEQWTITVNSLTNTGMSAIMSYDGA